MPSKLVVAALILGSHASPSFIAKSPLGTQKFWPSKTGGTFALRRMLSGASNTFPAFHRGTWRGSGLTFCDNNCNTHPSDVANGVCDDGGPGSEWSKCLRSDCADCGPTTFDFESVGCYPVVNTNCTAQSASWAGAGCAARGLNGTVTIPNFEQGEISCTSTPSLLSVNKYSHTDSNAPSGQRVVVCEYASRASASSNLKMDIVNFYRPLTTSLSSFTCPASFTAAKAMANDGWEQQDYQCMFSCGPLTCDPVCGTGIGTIGSSLSGLPPSSSSGISSASVSPPPSPSPPPPQGSTTANTKLAVTAAMKLWPIIGIVAGASVFVGSAVLAYFKRCNRCRRETYKQTEEFTGAQLTTEPVRA